MRPSYEILRSFLKESSLTGKATIGKKSILLFQLPRNICLVRRVTRQTIPLPLKLRSSRRSKLKLRRRLSRRVDRSRTPYDLSNIDDLRSLYDVDIIYINFPKILLPPYDNLLPIRDLERRFLRYQTMKSLLNPLPPYDQVNVRSHLLSYHYRTPIFLIFRLSPRLSLG